MPRVRWTPFSIVLLALTAWSVGAEAAENACTVVGAAVDSGGGDAFTRALSKGPGYAALAALVGGLLVSLTPCVYPMIAVTVSVFGAREARSRAQGVLLSLAFVLGIVAMFVPLGLVAGLTGGMFGAVLQSKWVIVGISVLFLAMAASMFGAFEFTLPSSLTNKLATVGGIGMKGAFVLGLVCGVIAAPCTGPVLTGILTWIAKTQSAGLGALAMAAFALGLGAPFFLVGAFAVQLPKSGRWMVHVKSLLGVVLVVVALWFLASAFPAMTRLVVPSSTFLAVAAGAVLLGLMLGAVHRSFEEPGAAAKARKGLGILLTTLGAFAFIAGLSKPSRTLAWEELSVADARAKAATEKRPLLLDFTAAWCGACKELDKHTFSEESVAQEAGRFVAVKVDATDDEDPVVAATMKEHKVVGLPTVLVYDSRGAEAVRCTDFVAAKPFLEAIKSVN
ncbi:MAG: thioredoxin family protein [Myxococcales bacterium]|nr:thioredoxin family protein [Myxococcales bacterium]